MSVTRRHIVQGIGAAIACSSVTAGVSAANTAAGLSARSETDETRKSAGVGGRNQSVEYGQATLPPGIRSRRVDNNNGVTMHVLEAGFGDPGRPCVVLL